MYTLPTASKIHSNNSRESHTTGRVRISGRAFSTRQPHPSSVPLSPLSTPASMAEIKQLTLLRIRLRWSTSTTLRTIHIERKSSPCWNYPRMCGWDTMEKSKASPMASRSRLEHVQSTSNQILSIHSIVHCSRDTSPS